MGPRLRIVQINDVYSLENLPRLLTLVHAMRTEDAADATLVVVAGDFLAPSLLSSLDAGKGMVACLNAIGVTHVIFGNHEDDVPPAELRERVRELHAKWIDTNVDGFEPKLPRSDVVTVTAREGRSVRVGLVGVVMNDPSVYRRTPFGGAAIRPANEAALAEATRLLREEGCACVVPITHQALEDDRALAHASIEPPFPVILGGHEHVPETERVGSTWIVKAGMDAVRAAVTDLTWNDVASSVPSVSTRLVPVASYAENQALRALVDVHMAKVHAIESASLVALAPGETLSSVGTRVRQTSMGAWVCSHLRDALGADVGVFNGGGIRASREYVERITFGDIKTELPFDNEVVVVSLPGAVLAEAITASRAHAPAESGGYLQVDDRLATTPIDPARNYCVATVRDLFLGMDHIEPLVRWAQANPGALPPAGSGREVKLVLVESCALALWRTLGGFEAIDANGDGRVTLEEIEAAIARVRHEAPSEVAAKLVLQALDKDHSGAVTPDEADSAERG
ncbi:MAG TPA: 5'-nucleotidase C-terminal domain-containing protein [Polyangiaceae bacterium]